MYKVELKAVVAETLIESHVEKQTLFGAFYCMKTWREQVDADSIVFLAASNEQGVVCLAFNTLTKRIEVVNHPGEVMPASPSEEELFDALPERRLVWPGGKGLWLEKVSPEFWEDISPVVNMKDFIFEGSYFIEWGREGALTKGKDVYLYRKRGGWVTIASLSPPKISPAYNGGDKLEVLAVYVL